MKRALLLGIAAAACGGSKPKTDVPAPLPTGAPPVAATAPQPPADPDAAPLPLWPEVHTGVLPNGLTYYVMHHGKPEKRAMMWLAVNAGSVDEDEDQRGLAHFDEHMAFNGTKRFPHQDLVNYLQSIGMRFGADLNAYTTWQQTVYQLEVPTDKPELIAKGFDILHDWAGDVSYDLGEVKSESGVVLEEWRLGRGAFMRLFDKHAKVMFKGTRYADRITIGLPEIIKAANRDALVRFYKDWYRPDQMAVIVVGDVDDAQVEQTIKAEFGDLKNPANERQHVAPGVPAADGTRVSIETDKELPVARLEIYNMVPHRSNASAHDMRRLFVERLYSTIVDDRLAQLVRKQEAPFVDAQVEIGSEVRAVDSFTRAAQVKNGRLEDALRALLTETARVERHGFTQAELDRARTEIMRSNDEAADREATTDSREFTDEVTRYFFLHELMIGRVAERDFGAKYLPQITVDELNALVKSFGSAENRAISISLPDGQPAITKDRVLQIIGEVEKSDIPAWQDKAVPTALMQKLPAPGKIVKEKKLDAVGVTEWTLSNGAKVVVKPADFEKDTVLLSAWSPGGTALASDKAFNDARFAPTVAALGGVGDYDSETLKQILAGKKVSVNLQISDIAEGVNASASAKDVETMLQLLYLKITQPRRDEEYFKTWVANTTEVFKNQLRSPEFEYARESVGAEYNNNPRRSFPQTEDFGKVDLDKSLAFFKDRFADVSDFTFVIVGEVDLDKLRPLVETYLASLPGKGRKDREKDVGVRKVSGIVKKSWKLGVEPKAQVRIDIHAPDTWSKDKDRDAYILGQVLSIRLREELREEKGGVYGVGASVSISRKPFQERVVSINFGCDPTRVDELIGAMNAVMDEIAAKGVTGDYVDKVKEMYARGRETELRQDRFWLGHLERAWEFGEDPAEIPDTAKMIARMTPEKIEAAAKHFFDRKQVYTAIRLPASDAKMSADPIPPSAPAAPAPATK